MSSEISHVFAHSAQPILKFLQHILKFPICDSEIQVTSAFASLQYVPCSPFLYVCGHHLLCRDYGLCVYVWKHSVPFVGICLDD